MRSCLYEGRLAHARTRPVAHRFDYPIFLWSIELDELPELDRRLRLFAHDRAGVFSLRDRDHDGAATIGLRAAAETFLAAHGIHAAADWRFRLLTHVRVLGYVFNPVTFTYCHAHDGTLVAVIAEVRNTFGKVHRYLLDERARVPAPFPAYRSDKLLHVSPFFDLTLAYRWHFRRADERLDIGMDVGPEDELAEKRAPVLFHAHLRGERRPLDDRQLLRMSLRYPWMTAQVLARIHWQAWKLWLAGAPFHSEPPYDPELARRRHARSHSLTRATQGGDEPAAAAAGPSPGARGAVPRP